MKNTPAASLRRTAFAAVLVFGTAAEASANPSVSNDFTAMTGWLSHQLAQGLGFNGKVHYGKDAVRLNPVKKGFQGAGLVLRVLQIFPNRTAAKFRPGVSGQGNNLAGGCFFNPVN